MKKVDLKCGMIVKIRRGEFGLVTESKILFKTTYVYLSSLTDNLKIKDRDDLDIVKVYNSRAIFCLRDLMDIKERDLDLVWEREYEINWTRVPIGTRVMVSDNKHYGFIEMVFIGYEPRLEKYPFIVANSMDDSVTSFKYCKVHPDVEIKEEWFV